jgi:hypothetical protein
MNQPASERAREARILCAITFHFDNTHLGFLAEVLRSLSAFAATALDMVIVTDALGEQELTPLRGLCADMPPGRSATIRSCRELDHPYHLTWCHKEIISNEFVRANQGGYSHFIYLEDDILLNILNFDYFVKFREILRPFGLLPAFVRTEYSADLGTFVSSDAFWPVHVPTQSHIILDDVVMVNLPNPYNPCFILDHQLADEYVRSRSFDRDASRALCPWGVRERAAMGLCLENVPSPFQSRYLVPVSRRTGSIPEFARIRHLPNNYADDPRSPLGKVPVDNMFFGVRAVKG